MYWGGAYVLSDTVSDLTMAIFEGINIDTLIVTDWGKSVYFS